MKPTITIIIGMCILLTIEVIAYVPLETYKEIPVKFYSDTINKSECFKILDNIPEEYLEGVNLIRFKDLDQDTLGTYNAFTQHINIYDNCGRDTIIHELAHHRHYMNGKLFLDHEDDFCRYYLEIINKSGYYINYDYNAYCG